MGSLAPVSKSVAAAVIGALVVWLETLQASAPMTSVQHVIVAVLLGALIPLGVWLAPANKPADAPPPAGRDDY